MQLIYLSWRESKVGKMILRRLGSTVAIFERWARSHFLTQQRYTHLGFTHSILVCDINTHTYIDRYKHLQTHIKWATSILRSVGNKRLTAISFPCQLWNKKEMLPVNTERVRGCVHKMVIWMCLCEWVCDCVCVCVCFGWCIMNKRTSNSPAQTRHRNDELGSFVGSWANWWIWIESEHQIIQILLNSRLHQRIKLYKSISV